MARTVLLAATQRDADAVLEEASSSFPGEVLVVTPLSLGRLRGAVVRDVWATPAAQAHRGYEAMLREVRFVVSCGPRIAGCRRVA